MEILFSECESILPFSTTFLYCSWEAWRHSDYWSIVHGLFFLCFGVIFLIPSPGCLFSGLFQSGNSCLWFLKSLSCIIYVSHLFSPHPLPQELSGATSEDILSSRLSCLCTEPYSGHHGREQPISQPWFQGIRAFLFRSITWVGSKTGKFYNPKTVQSQWENNSFAVQNHPLISEPIY